MSGLYQTSQSDIPISVEEVKPQIGVYHDQNDAQIEGYLMASIGEVEHRTDRSLYNREYTLYLDKWQRSIPIPKSPVILVNSITYSDEDGITQDFTDFSTDYISNPSRIIIPSTVSLPTLLDETPNVIAISFTAGYIDEYGATDIPAGLRQAVYLLVGHYWANREASLVGTISKELDFGVDTLCAQYVVNNNWYWDTR